MGPGLPRPLLKEEVMKVFTIEVEKVKPGADVVPFRLGNGVEIPAIVVGESGRGRALGVLPVSGAKPGDVIYTADVGTSRAGRPKLFVPGSGTDDKAIVVLRSKIGFRGGNEHTGDRTGHWKCQWCEIEGKEEDIFTIPEKCPKCGALTLKKLLPFPGEILVSGVIAQGDAGRMGFGNQIVAVVPRGVWFRLGMTGRLYGRPRAYYYMFDGSKVIAMTWEERVLTADLE